MTSAVVSKRVTFPFVVIPFKSQRSVWLGSFSIKVKVETEKKKGKKQFLEMKATKKKSGCVSML